MPDIAKLRHALPFWMSLALIPLVAFGATRGGWALWLMPLATWWQFGLLDAIVGANEENQDPNTDPAHLTLYRLLTIIWFPLQFGLTTWMLWYVPQATHLDMSEKFGAFFGLGILMGTIGITYAHELMHQKSALERWLGDLLMTQALYGHFRSEHLRVHHLHVATPRDPVTARYNEGFHRFFPRVLVACLKSSWHAEVAMLARRNLPAWHASNPFWRYGALQLGMLAVVWVLGGALAVGLFAFAAFIAIWQLEVVNYVEHYGLTRRHLGEGKYEHVLPRHSWNADPRPSNWLLINLQRHSDHHYKPDRRFPLLQTYSADDAPQLPFGYPVMIMAAMVPPLFKRMMNPRVRAWRQQNYPDITDWHAYNKGLNPTEAPSTAN